MSANRPAAKACPLPIATARMSQDLLRLSTRLRGELLKAANGEPGLVPPDQAAACLAGTERLLELLGVEYQPEALAAVRTLPKRKRLPWGGIRRGVLRSLQGQEWKTYRQIATWIQAKHGLSMSDDEFKHFLQKVREAVHALKSRGFVECETERAPRSGNDEQRWRLSSVFRG